LKPVEYFKVILSGVLYYSKFNDSSNHHHYNITLHVIAAQSLISKVNRFARITNIYYINHNASNLVHITDMQQNWSQQLYEVLLRQQQRKYRFTSVAKKHTGMSNNYRRFEGTQQKLGLTVCSYYE